MDIYIGGKRVRVNPDDPATHKGKGGEADIIDIGGGQVLKLYKQPQHPDLAGDTLQQQLVAARLKELQRKLRDFPANLPTRVVAPTALATNTKGQIMGYTMPYLASAEILLSYAKKNFRMRGISQAMMLRILRDMHRTVAALHGQRVVIGDFNYMNVMVEGEAAHFIDADSWQFGSYYCTTFMPRFVDPLLCALQQSKPMLVKPHNPLSDWYAFAAILMECLLFVGPYGGIYTPANHQQQITTDERPLKRISVFRPNVIYPKFAIHYSALPDTLLHWLENMFVKDTRDVFPEPLLDMRWTTCTACRTEYARTVCPKCVGAATAAVIQTITVRGTVTATRVFRTPGTIVYSTVENGRLCWLMHDGKSFRREDDSIAIVGALDPFLRFKLQGDRTYVGRDHTVAVLHGGQVVEQFVADRFKQSPLFATTSAHRYWIQGGRLLRDSAFAPDRIGDVVAGQTQFWVGSDFGFGYSRPGNRLFGFVFEAAGQGINDAVPMPVCNGPITDATCVFGSDRAWCFIATYENGKGTHRCIIVNRRGQVLAQHEAVEGDGSWLGALHGVCATGQFLLVATDHGIVRVEVANGICTVTREFPDTEPFVEAGSTLHAAADGLYVVGTNEITKLTIR